MFPAEVAGEVSRELRRNGSLWSGRRCVVGLRLELEKRLWHEERILMSKSSSDPRPSPFPVTRWSLVLAARGSRSGTAAEALEELCRLYWKPIYGFIRTRSHVPEDALDLTQGFFAHLLEKDLIHRADSQLGRFRSYLLGCVKNYLSDEHARARTRKRGGEWTQVDFSVDEVEEWLRLTRASAPDRPDVVYDCACAISLLHEALRLLEAECASRGRTRLFKALQPYLQSDSAAPDYAQTARALGTTPGTIKVTVHRLRTRYRSLLRSVVAQTLADPLGVDEELQSLQAALEAGSPGVWP